MAIDTSDFLEAVRPALETGDANLLAERVSRRWAPRTICELLAHHDSDVRRVAAITLGLVGDASCIDCLARALHDSDEQVNEMAEHSLWSVWFRSASPEAAGPFQEGMTLLGAESYELAVDKFREAIRLDPAFAEAYNQCSIARFFLGQWRDSLEDARQATLRQPTHFGAMASMGHCHAHLGELRHALDCYRRAIAINPRMTAIADAVQRLERELKPHSSLMSTPDPATFLGSTFRTN